MMELDEIMEYIMSKGVEEALANNIAVELLKEEKTTLKDADAYLKESEHLKSEHLKDNGSFNVNRNTKLTRTMDNKLKEFACDHGMSVSKTIRVVLDSYFK